MKLPTLEGISDAARLVRAHQPETPLVPSVLLSRASGADVWLKNETVSRIASFKLRGALTALSRGWAQGRGRRAVTSSTGNHGQGVSCAAAILGGTADIFLPVEANPLKAAKIQALGGRLHHVGRDLDDAKDHAKRFAAEHDAIFVDDGESLDLMEGAGTVGLEIAEALPDIDAVLVPMGSGTLASGCAAALKALQPRAQVIAVQAKGSPAMVQSFHARRPVEHEVDTVADGLVCRVPAELALNGLWTHVDDALLTTDEELLRAARALIEQANTLVEPSGAAGLAALWQRRESLRGRRVVLVLTGSNITLGALQRALGLDSLEK